MSSHRGREMVFCHRCEDEWYRDEHGLTCPQCHSDFVEVIEADNNPYDFLHSAPDPEDQFPDDAWGPLGMHSPNSFAGMGHPTIGHPPMGSNMGPTGFFSNFNPPQPANRAGPDFQHTEYRTPNGGMVITSFSYSSNGTTTHRNDTGAQVMNNLGGMLQGLLGNIQARNQTMGDTPLRSRNANEPQNAQPVVDTLPNIMSQFFPPPNASRTPGSPPPQNPFATADDGTVPPNALFGMMRMLLSGTPMMMPGHGDAAYSQEDFDRIMSQLLEQAQQGGGEPPASQAEQAKIPKVTVDQEWLDRQEHKECTICMEEATLGDEISELWCGHWYHPFCIKQWLDAHGACPLCRKTLEQGRQEWEAKNGKREKRERKRSSRHHHRDRSAGGGTAHDSRGYRDDGGSSTSGGSSGGGIRDRLSSLFGGGRR